MEITCQLAGANFRPAEAKEAIYALTPGDTLTLERDPTNQYDSNAIKVLTEDGTFLGFVPKDSNTELAAILDGDRPTYSCEVIEENGLKPTLQINAEDLGD